VDVLELARELKLLKLGNVSLDGTHLKANASIDQNVKHRLQMPTVPSEGGSGWATVTNFVFTCLLYN
jgi:hypothetical protein